MFLEQAGEKCKNNKEQDLFSFPEQNIINEDDQKEEIEYNNSIEVDKAINLNRNINNKRKNYQNMRNKNYVSCTMTPRSSFSETSMKKMMYYNNTYNSLNHY